MTTGATTPKYTSEQFEREALSHISSIFEALVADPQASIHRAEATRTGFDAVAKARGRRWLIEFKSSASPGIVVSAANQVAAWMTQEDPDDVPVLVVPFMTPAGAKAAAERGLNWIDLSGNAQIRAGELYVSVQGWPNKFVVRGRPASAFAPKSARISKALLRDPERWWRQKELSEHTELDAGRVSRIVRRLHDDALVERNGFLVRPRDPELLLDAWADEYRFTRHDIIGGHISGSGIDLARELDHRLYEVGIDHAFTGLPAAWALDRFARFRLNTIYVHGDPRPAADAIGLRRDERGANVQLVGPEDSGVFEGQHEIEALPCVSPVQTYLDLLALPERASEAAAELRHRALWNAPI